MHRSPFTYFHKGFPYVCSKKHVFGIPNPRVLLLELANTTNSCPYSSPALLVGPGGTFPLLRLHYKVATFEPELPEYVPFTTAVLQGCDFRAGALGVRFLTRKGRLMRVCSPEMGGRSCSKAFKEQEVPPKPALQNQRPPNNKNCVAGRVCVY